MKSAIYAAEPNGRRRSGIVVFVRAAAEIGRGHHGVASRDAVSGLLVDQAVARRHVHPAADGLLGIHGEIPVRESTARRSACRPACGRCPGCRRRRVGTGRIAGIRFGLVGVQICRELSVVVVAFDIEGREHGLCYRYTKRVALVVGPGIGESERCI